MRCLRYLPDASGLHGYARVLTIYLACILLLSALDHRLTYRFGRRYLFCLFVKKLAMVRTYRVHTHSFWDGRLSFHIRDAKISHESR